MQDAEVEGGLEVTESRGWHAGAAEVDDVFEGGLETVESRGWCAGAVELDVDNDCEAERDSALSVRM